MILCQNIFHYTSLLIIVVGCLSGEERSPTDEISRRIYEAISSILGLKAADVMKDPIYASKDTSVYEAAKILDESDRGEIIVLDEEKRVIGIITERDIVRRGVAKDLDLKSTKVGEIMTKKVVVVLADADLGMVAKVMNSKGIRRVPVVNRFGKLLGVIDSRDLAGALTSQRDILEKMVSGLEAQLKKLAKELMSMEELKKLDKSAERIYE